MIPELLPILYSIERVADGIETNKRKHGLRCRASSCHPLGDQGRDAHVSDLNAGLTVKLPPLSHRAEILVEARALDAVTIAATSRGKSGSESGCGANGRRLRIGLKEAGLINPGLTFHGLRHAVVTIEREKGCSSAGRLCRHDSAGQRGGRNRRLDEGGRFFTEAEIMGQVIMQRMGGLRCRGFAFIEKKLNFR